MTLAADPPGIRVLVAEDEELVRDALARLVSSDPALEVVALAGDATSAADLAASEHPDVAFVDVTMPGGGALATREILRRSPGTNVVAFTGHEDRATVLEMLRAGVVGYIVKGSSKNEIIEAVHRAAVGQGTLSTAVTADVIHELSALLDQSQRLSDELQQLDRMKRDLIQILSHEIFTPITTIQGFAQLVSHHREELSSKDIGELAVGVERASGRLRRLVGNLRAAAQLDREGVEIATRPVAPADLIERATAQFHDRERIRVHDGGGGLTECMWADPELASQALAILVENALDFSPATEAVEIRFTPGARTMTLSVADRGAGIAPGMRERIFAPFEQAQDLMTRTHEGLGIGLFLAARIMEAIGGTVEVHARDGGGAVFSLTFAAHDARASELDAG